MVAGHLREKNGYFHIILNYKDVNGNRQSKSVSTGLPIKGNKKRVDAMLLKTRKEFNPDTAMSDKNTLFADFLTKWLRDVMSKVDAETYALYSYDAKTFIIPYFKNTAIEIVGLKWDAIDFAKKTLTIKHTVTEVRLDGKVIIVEKDRTKTKSSYRTLPLVAPFEELLHRLKAEQELNQKVCGKAYCKDYPDYIYVNEIGERVKPNYITQHFAIVLKNHNLKKIRFHDLRHYGKQMIMGSVA